MQKSVFTKEERNTARKSHKEDKRLNTEWFNNKRIELATELITALTKNTPTWGSVKVDFPKKAI